MAANTVTLVDQAGRVISSTDNGDGTATLATSGGSGGTASSVKVLDTGGTNALSVSAGGAAKVDGSAVTQPVSATALPLPTGAATAAKQPALGTAGAAATDVITVQGIASGTAQPVSAASLPLPSGASTAAKQPALGTAGAAAADVLSVQGIASMTALKTDGSGVTQPVSGTVTANAGTNLNTSALALDATLTGGTAQAKLTDGTNIGHILKSDGTAAGQNSQLTAGGFLSVPFITTGVAAVGSTDAANYTWVSLHVTTQGTSSSIAFQGSNDNTNWVTAVLSLGSYSSVGASSTSTANAFYHGPLTFRYFRLNVTGISAGTTAGTLVFSASPRATIAMSAAQLGTWTVTQSGAFNVGLAAATTGGYSYNHISTATTTTVKSGAGTFHSLAINTKGSASTATIYDSTTGSGTVIAVVDTSGATGAIPYDIAFTTGLTVVTVAAQDLTLAYK